MVLKRSQLYFCGFCKKPVPDMGGDSKKFLRPTSFGKQPKRLLSPKAHFRFPKNRTIFLQKGKIFLKPVCLKLRFSLKKKKRKSPHRSRRGGILQIRLLLSQQ